MLLSAALTEKWASGDGAGGRFFAAPSEAKREPKPQTKRKGTTRRRGQINLTEASDMVAIEQGRATEDLKDLQPLEPSGQNGRNGRNGFTFRVAHVKRNGTGFRLKDQSLNGTERLPFVLTVPRTEWDAHLEKVPIYLTFYYKAA